MNNVKLTSFSHASGWAAKLSPDQLGQILCKLKIKKYPQVLTDFSNNEDSGIYKLNDEVALVQSVDFFTPVIDDPFYFGQIAVANSLSDIYAMGAIPITAMNIAEFPVKKLNIEYFEKILQGALEKLEEADVALLGGHTVEGEELKYGLSVTGIVNPDNFYSNDNAKVGDKIIITKKIGTGIIATAIKGDFADEKVIEEAINIMTELNKKTSEIVKNFKVNAVTDITGFGLIGHLLEVLMASKKNAEICCKNIMFIKEAFEYADMGLIPEGLYRNKDFYSCKVEFSDNIDELTELLLFDPQTSGGFIIFVNEDEAETLLNELKKNNIDSNIIGEVTSNGEGRLYIKWR